VAQCNGCGLIYRTMEDFRAAEPLGVNPETVRSLTNKTLAGSAIAAGEIDSRPPVAEAMEDSGACKVRAREKAHDRTQAWSSQGAGEKEARHIGFEVVIQYRSTPKQLEIATQGRRHVVEARQIQAKAGSGDDMISALGDATLGRV
jgi:hypothetical protein